MSGGHTFAMVAIILAILVQGFNMAAGIYVHNNLNNLQKNSVYLNTKQSTGGVTAFDRNVSSIWF